MAVLETSDQFGGLPRISSGEFEAHLQDQAEQGEHEAIQAAIDWLAENNPELLCGVVGLASQIAQRSSGHSELFSPASARMKELMITHTLTVLGVLRKHDELKEFIEFEQQFAA
jgi:hypothetical protein